MQADALDAELLLFWTFQTNYDIVLLELWFIVRLEVTVHGSEQLRLEKIIWRLLENSQNMFL
ncbi:MAG: hypothetical protein HDT30_13465 [Clostridiales bacterium]|nr:hypothetical protein [Clostridiales bacterium]